MTQVLFWQLLESQGAEAAQPEESAEENVVDALVQDWASTPSKVCPTKTQGTEQTDTLLNNPVLLFLQQSFPGKDISSLQTALRNADDDVDVAVDTLFAHDILEQGERSVEESKSSRGAGLDLEVLSHGLQAKRKNIPKKHAAPSKKGDAVTVSMTDHRSAHHIYYDTRMRPKAPTTLCPDPIDHTASEALTDEQLARHLQEVERKAVTRHDIPVSEQQWLLSSSTLTQLAILLDIPQPKVQGIFNHASFNLHVTLARCVALAAARPEAQAAANTGDFDAIVSALANITHKNQSDIRQLLIATKGQQDAVLDIVQLQDIVAASADGLHNRPDVLDPSGRLLDNTGSKTIYTPTVTAKRNNSKSAAAVWLEPNARGYAARAAQPTTPLPMATPAAALRKGQSAVVLPASAQVTNLDDVAEGLDLEIYSAEECQARVDEFRAKRDMALRQAGVAARQSRVANLGGATSVYAEEARKYGAQARRWQLRGASALVHERKSGNNTISYVPTNGKQVSESIDLHGLSVHEALTVMQQHVHRWETRKRDPDQPGRVAFEVVTGRGSHSKHYTSVLRPAVIRLLTQLGWSVDHTSNPGVLYVEPPKV
ncbi:hypothetical protein MVES_000979 [Malassezia vespertilionis]|uniref:Smr domain-containing protein n=1 Tax=Malassezia vespertilionis TaxID=2020962 RepID=A0A2N1JF57_9BASI|nr:hypothetical protein MVES_000979 [Malassezia vespertilionis]